MNSKHTPGPWVYTYGAVYQGTEAEVVDAHSGKLGSRDPRIVRLLLADRDTGATRPTERDANLRRAAECVNACEGIDDPAAALAEVKKMLGEIVQFGNPASSCVAVAALGRLGRCACEGSGYGHTGTWTDARNVGRCLTEYVCGGPNGCGRRFTIDSSD